MATSTAKAHKDDSVYFMDEREVAKKLRVSTRTVSRLRGEGKIGFHRLPGGQIRFSPEDLTAFLSDCYRPASGGKKARRRRSGPKKVRQTKSGFSMREFDKTHAEKALGMA